MFGRCLRLSGDFYLTYSSLVGEEGAGEVPGSLPSRILRFLVQKERPRSWHDFDTFRARLIGFAVAFVVSVISAGFHRKVTVVFVAEEIGGFEGGWDAQMWASWLLRCVKFANRSIIPLFVALLWLGIPSYAEYLKGFSNTVKIGCGTFLITSSWFLVTKFRSRNLF